MREEILALNEIRADRTLSPSEKRLLGKLLSRLFHEGRNQGTNSEKEVRLWLDTYVTYFTIETLEKYRSEFEEQAPTKDDEEEIEEEIPRPRSIEECWPKETRQRMSRATSKGPRKGFRHWSVAFFAKIKAALSKRI